MRNISSALELVLWLGIILPMGFDPFGLGKYLVLYYHGFVVRYNYLAIALLGVFYLAQIPWRPVRLETLKTTFKRPSTWFLFAFLGLGLLGTFTSIYQQRSFPVWVWSALILGWMPLTLLQLSEERRLFFLLSYGAVLGLHCLVLFYDNFMIHFQHVTWALGNIFNNGGGGYRASAFRQEPSYLSAWMLMNAACFFSLRSHPVLQKFPAFPKLKWLLMGFSFVFLFTAATTTSRMGLLASGLLLCFWVVLFLGKLAVQKKLLQVLLYSLITLTLLFLSHRAITIYFPSFNERLKGIGKEKKLDASYETRVQNSTIAFKVFLDFPFLGAGPGSAGAWASQNGYFAESEHFGPIAIPNPNTPLSNNVYSEILSEWGLLGATLWGLFILLYFIELKHLPAFGILMALGLIWLSCETLPRFDIWFAIFFTTALFQTRPFIFQPNKETA